MIFQVARSQELYTDSTNYPEAMLDSKDSVLTVNTSTGTFMAILMDSSAL